MDQLEEITLTIIDYLFDRTDSMQVEIEGEIVFSNQALIHMADVKDLFVQGQQLSWILLCIMILVLVYLFLRFPMVKPYLLKYSIWTIAVILVMVLSIAMWAMVDFELAFEWFHRVLFPDEIKFRDSFFGPQSPYYEESGVNNMMLVLILSENLFANIGLRIAINVAFTYILWLLVVSLIHKKGKKVSVSYGSY
mgnify:CR=1 FL=1